MTMDDILFLKKYAEKDIKYKDIKYIIPQSQYDWAIREGVISEDGIFVPSQYIPDDAIVEVDISKPINYNFDEEGYRGLKRNADFIS